MKPTVVAALVALVATARGGGNDDHSSINMGGSTGSTAAGGAPTRTVDIDKVDIAFDPKTLSVQRGEQIEFVFHDKGKIVHDAIVGDTAAQADHEKEMHEDGSMAGDHGMGETAITVDPGQTGWLTYTFDKPGTIESAATSQTITPPK